MSSSAFHPVYQVTNEELLSICEAIYPKIDSRKRFRERMTLAEIARLRQSLALIPPASGNDTRLVDLGPSTYWFAAYRWLGYRKVVAITKLDPDPNLDQEAIDLLKKELDLEVYCCDAEKAKYPIESDSVNVVCAFEILEHFAADPMAALSETNRILCNGGLLALSTPNIASWRSVLNVLRGRNPNNWSAYATDPMLSQVRHHREYTTSEVINLVRAAGMETLYVKSLTEEVRRPFNSLIKEIYTLSLICISGGSLKHRGTRVLISSRKICPLVDRYPKWLYADFCTNADSV